MTDVPKFDPADFKPLEFYTGAPLRKEQLGNMHTVDMRWPSYFRYASENSTAADDLYRTLVLAFLRNYDRVVESVADDENELYQEGMRLMLLYKGYLEDLTKDKDVPRGKLNEAIAKMREYLFKL